MKRREIFIELTSLLDVILIMLFVLLTQAKTQTADALAAAQADRAQVTALEQQLAESRAETDAARSETEALQQEAEGLLSRTEKLQEEADSAKRRLLSRDLVTENSLVLTVSVPDGRQIRLETDGGGSQTISYAWEDDNYARNALLSAVTDYEDAVMIQTAKRINADCIVTRNIKDYQPSDVPVYLPEELLRLP